MTETPRQIAEIASYFTGAAKGRPGGPAWRRTIRATGDSGSRGANPARAAIERLLLFLNQIAPAGAVLDQNGLPRVRMPNRDGFTSPDPRPDAP